MAINNTFDPSDGYDDSERQAAEARALEVGSKLVDDQAAAVEERYQAARDADLEGNRYAGKYKSAEDLEKAYLELQKKLGEKSAEPEAEEEVQEDQEEAVEEEEDEEDDGEPSEALQALLEATNEFDTDEGITEDTLARLSQLDSRTLVETWAEYVRTQRQEQQQVLVTEEQAAGIRQSVGGDQQYQQMLGWAAQNLSPDEIAAYDSVMNGGDYGAMYWAAQGLKSRFADSVGYEGTQYTGQRAPKPADGFRSQAELARAISDPRYREDPAYRQDVEAKLARSGSLL